MPGTVTLSMEVGGPVRLNISSKPAGTPDKRAVAELNRLGLEHFGFDVPDLAAELDVDLKPAHEGMVVEL